MSGRKGAYVSVQTKDLRPFGSAGSSGLQQATAAISGSRDHRSADRVVEGGRTARAESPLTSKSTHRAAGGEGSARVKPSSTPRSAHCMAEGGGAACAESPSTPGSYRHTEHRMAIHSKQSVSMADFEKLKQQVSELKATTTVMGSKLEQVEEDVRETKGDTRKILDLLMRNEKEPKMLPAPPKRKTIMPPPTKESSESDEDDEIKYVLYGKGDQERLSAVPIWGKKNTSTPVACKGSSSAMSSSSSSSFQRKDLSKSPGCSAMVVSLKSKQKSIPLPETLGKSEKESSSSPRIEKLHGTGLVQCTDLKSLVRSMKDLGYTEVPEIVEKTKKVSIHFEMVLANAFDLGDDEAQTLAMLSADSGRSATLIPPACQIREEVIACFSSINVGMFMQFFARMAENYHSNPKNGVEISGQLYSYVVLGTDVQYCTSFLKYLRRN